MTVASEQSFISYVGAGNTLTYSYPFKILDDDDLRVTVMSTANVETQLTKTTHYTVTGVGNGSGGTIVLVNGSFDWITGGFFKLNYVLAIRRAPALLQETRLRDQGTFYPSSVEAALDRLEMQAQKLQNEVSRSIKIPETENPSSFTTSVVPSALRASGTLGFDASGNITVAAGTLASGLTVSAYIATLIDDANAAAARLTLGFTGSSGLVGGGDLTDATVTYAKIQSVTAARLLGRTSSSAGVVQELTTASGLAVTGTILGLTGSISYSRVQGADCANNSVTPNTQFDLDAEAIMLSNSTGIAFLRINPGAAIVNNISTAGPIVNGRDQAGAFGAASWVHFYWVWDGATLATVSSAVAPPTGPTLPASYTHWAYAGAVYLSGGGTLVRTKIKGAWAHYDSAQAALSGGSAVIETAVSLTALIPPNALAVSMQGVNTLSTNGGGGILETTRFRVVTASDAAYFNTGINIASATNYGSLSFTLPNVGQNIYYLHTNLANPGNIAGRSLEIYLHGYKLPNGGE